MNLPDSPLSDTKNSSIFPPPRPLWRLPSFVRFAFAGLLAHGASLHGQSLPKILVAANGKGFVTENGRPWVPIGVNYYRPGTGWAPQVWKQFDAEATAHDFQRMRELGVNCVRVFLTYGSFLQEPDHLDPQGLRKLDRFLEIAEEAGIYVHPTGPDHWEGLPEWARGDRIADPSILRALESFWEQLAARYQNRHVIFAYDLLNEPAVAWDSTAMLAQWNAWLKHHYPDRDAIAKAWGKTPPTASPGTIAIPTPNASPHDPQLLDFQHFRETVADNWTRRQTAAIRRTDPHAMVTVGLIQWSVPALLPGIRHYSGFNPHRQAEFLDFMEIHFYPLADGFYEYSENGRQQNLAYLESVVREVARAKRPVVLAEFGWYGGGQLTINNGRHPPASETDQADWCRSVVNLSAGLASGWLNWGLYDQPEARDVSQLTGLLTADGKTKAWGRAFHSLAESYAQNPPPIRELNSRPDLDWDQCLTSPEAARQYRDRYLQAFTNSPALSGHEH